MAATRVRVTEPTPAEQVLTVLRAAGSLTVQAAGENHQLQGHEGVRRDATGGGLRLVLPGGSDLLAEVAAASDAGADGVPAVLDWTDVAPVAVPDRVRRRVRITGRLSGPLSPCPDGTAVRLAARQVVLTTAQGAELVDPDELRSAEPDLVARHEADLLAHLAEAHQSHVLALARLAHTGPCGADRAVRAVVPLQLDRHGIVLRLVGVASAHTDIRLPFTPPLADLREVGDRVHALLSR